MPSEPHTYRRTETGRRAWESLSSGLPAAYRRILDVVQTAACPEEIFAALPEYGRREVQRWLDELETLCFLEHPSAAAEASGPPAS